MKYPKVVIVGKPNVGKSTLFNRLCGRKIAIVTGVAGTTRNRKEYLASFDDLNFLLIDTVGWENEHKKHQMKSLMITQTQESIKEADIIIFMVEAKNHLSSDDLEFVELIRKSNKKIILVVNKSESKITILTNDLMPFGFGEPIYIAAEHSLGLDTLYSALSSELKNSPYIKDEAENEKLLLAIVGRPNAGKSTIFNQLLGFQRSITSAEAGTTRDAITYDLSFNDTKLSLIDTAGLRKKNKVHEEIEKLSNAQTITAIRRANVVALVIDATQGVEQQDLAIAQMVINEGKGLFLVLNKHDLVKDKKKLEDDIDHLFSHSLTAVLSVPTLYTNALTGVSVEKMISTALEVKKSWEKILTTSMLNKWLESSINNHQPSFTNDGQRIKLKYITQIKSRPLTFKVFVNFPSSISKHYKRYLNHDLQKHFNFIGTPIRIIFSKTKNPYEA
ncbi:MAG: ribosome biogenesis GTPase Der [Candidatus Midichloria sp.]|nr:MAG: ribosome biogenesis GTPase Der [Candidatus Midichloria sp.]